MRVLFLTGSGEVGGAERSALDIMASLRQAQPTWTLDLIVPAQGPMAADAAALDVRTDVLPFDPALARIGEASADCGPHMVARLARGAAPLAAYARRLRATIRTSAPDIVHTHGVKVHLLGAWANPGTSAVVWHLHDYIGRRAASAALLRRSLRRCAALVANSVSVGDDARETFGRRVTVTPLWNGVDLERFTPDGPRLDLDGLAGCPTPQPSPVRVGLLATFGRWKGHTTFMDALAQLPRDLSIAGYIIGGPLYQTDSSQYSPDELRAYARRAGVADRVAFTGFVREAGAALRALDIVVHASTEPEPFGLAIAEAMACGRAVIMADAGGARELVTPGVDALSHEPGNARSLAERILALAVDGRLRRRVAAAARETAIRRFDRTRLASELLPVYERALQRRACA